MGEPNERLRAAIASAGMRFDDVARSTGIDPKTVERWVTSGRMPHRRSRVAVAELLGAAPEYLWPDSVQEARTQAASAAELVHFYPSRGAVPPDLWWSVIDQAREAIDIVAYAANFLFESYDLANLVRRKADAGVRLRIAVADETCEAVRERGLEEGTNGYLERGCQLARRYLRDLNGYRSGAVQIRVHTERLYNSIYRFDSDVIVNSQVQGAPAGQNPVLHLRRVPGGRVFSHYLQSFDWIWERATPEPAYAPLREAVSQR